jgi:hypothetical protein
MPQLEMKYFQIYEQNIFPIINRKNVWLHLKLNVWPIPAQVTVQTLFFSWKDKAASLCPFIA